LIPLLSFFETEPPELLKLFDRKNLEEGQKLTVTCSTTKGSKPLTFEWLKDGHLLAVEKYRINNDEDYSMLKIDSLNSVDGGNYTCKASNAFGSDSSIFEVQIKRKKKKKSKIVMKICIYLEIPKWLVEPQDISTNAGTDVKIECKSSGSPLPTVSWFKHSKPNQFITSSSRLELYDIRYSSSGFYECIADNGIDKPLKKVIRITINGTVGFVFDSYTIHLQKTMAYVGFYISVVL